MGMARGARTLTLVSRPIPSPMISFFLTHETSLCLLDHPLAEGFPLDQGKVSFAVPNVKPRNNYIVVRAYRVHHLSFLRRSPWLPCSHGRLGQRQPEIQNQEMLLIQPSTMTTF